MFQDCKEMLKNWFPTFAIRNLSLLSIANGSALVTGLIYSILVVRGLDSYRYGQLLIVISATSILTSIIFLKIHTPLLKELRNALDNNMRHQFDESYSAALVTVGIYGAAGYVLIGTGMFLDLVFDVFEMRWGILILLYYSSQVLNKASQIYFKIFQANQMFGNHSFLHLTQNAIMDFFPLLFLSQGVQGIFIGYLVGEAIVFLVVYFLYFAPFSGSKIRFPSFQFSLPAIKSLFHQAKDYHLAQLTGSFGSDGANLIIAQLTGARGLSIFNIGEKLFKAFNPIIRTLRTYLFPRLVEKRNRNFSEFRYTVKKYICLIFGFLLFLGGALVPISFEILPALYGQEFITSAYVFCILVVGYILGNPFSSIFREICFATDRIRIYRNITFAVTPLYLIVLTILTAPFGYFGSAVAKSCFNGFKGMIHALFSYKFLTLYDHT